MTWKSHIAIATACTIPFNPALIPAATLGATAPDQSEWVLKFFGVDVQHRGVAHYEQKIIDEKTYKENRFNLF